MGGYLPSTLGGTKVTINGKNAYLNYVSPAQINLQAPDDAGTGSVAVTVTSSSGTANATVTIQAVMPGLFTSSNQVLGVRVSDGALLPGAAVKPGDVVALFGTGLGPTSPSEPAGLAFSGAYPTTTVPAVTIGGTAATVLYCGLIGAGLYQINLTIPGSLAVGTYPVVVTQAGVSSPASAAVINVAASGG